MLPPGVCGQSPALPVSGDRVILKAVSALSNFVKQSNAGPVASMTEYRVARPEEVHDGLALVLGADGPGTDAQVQEFIEFATLRGIDLSNLWLAGGGGRLAWALLPVVSPGKTMLLLTPPSLPDGLDVGPLIQLVCDWFAARGGHLGQALLNPEHSGVRDIFVQHQFKEIATLQYLQGTTRRTAQPPQLPDGFRWETYSQATHPLFARAISQSYRGSLDCPALNGLRDIEDIIAGHQASGLFDPQYWFVLLEADEPCAVLLLTRVPRNDLAELVYLGLVPAARRRGIGDLMMRQAIWAIRQMGLQRLTLAVDSQNAPALKLYYRHGLQHAGCKKAMLRDLRVVSGQSSVVSSSEGGPATDN
jgi:mycothiol synthase